MPIFTFKYKPFIPSKDDIQKKMNLQIGLPIAIIALVSEEGVNSLKLDEEKLSNTGLNISLLSIEGYGHLVGMYKLPDDGQILWIRFKNIGQILLRTNQDIVLVDHFTSEYLGASILKTLLDLGGELIESQLQSQKYPFIEKEGLNDLKRFSKYRWLQKIKWKLQARMEPKKMITWI